MEPGINAHAIFDGQRRALLQVSLAADNGFESGDASAACCLTEGSYERLQDLVSRFRPLGDAQSSSPVAVVGPSGWATTSTDHTNARVVRFEKTCDDTRGTCGVARFTVDYCVSIEGAVTGKRASDVTFRATDGQVLDHRLEHLLRVEGAEVEVSAGDYSRFRKGDCVRVDGLLTNVLARLSPCAPR